MRLRQLFTPAIVALMTAICAEAPADIVYQTGELENPANWLDSADGTTGRPGAGDVGVISFNGTLNVGNATTTEGGTNDAGNTITGFDNAIINHTSGTLRGGYNWNNAGSTYNLQGGSIESVGNFNANSGSIFNLSSGTLLITGAATGTDLIVNNSSGGINVDGSAVIETQGQFDLRLNVQGAFFSIDPAWTGSFNGALETNLAAWQAELVGGASGNGTDTTNTNFVDVGGTQITADNFASFFETAPLASGGTSLSLISVSVPEPSSLAVLALGALGFVTRRRRS